MIFLFKSLRFKDLRLRPTRIRDFFMKQVTFFVFVAFLLSSCAVKTPVHTSFDGSDDFALTRASGTLQPSVITESLFIDNEATISEENIQKILDGTFRLPEKLRVAVVRLESRQRQAFRWSGNNETILRARQSHLDLFYNKLNHSQRVQRVSIVPEILISSNPTFVTIREAAVRTQADVVAIFSTHSDIYTRSRMFSSDDIKAFATTQFILLDVRTGLIPFSTIVTRDYLSQRIREIDFDVSEARSRVMNRAIMLSLSETGVQLMEFLNTEL